jgi:hypothetical protein
MRRGMTAEQKSKLAQGLFFGLLFLYIGSFMTGVAREYGSVKMSGRISMVMGGVIVLWGISQCFPKPK